MRTILPTHSIVAAVFSLGLLLTGCGKANHPVQAPGGTPVMQPIMETWTHGSLDGAVRQFVATDWTARPLFPPESTLSLTEERFKALSDTDRQTTAGEMLTQMDSLKRLAAAVVKAGQDAAAAGDHELARNHFTALRQCGQALDEPQTLAMVKLVGQAMINMADTELAKLPN